MQWHSQGVTGLSGGRKRNVLSIMGVTNNEQGTLSRCRKVRARVGTKPQIKEAAHRGGFCAHSTGEEAEVQTLGVGKKFQPPGWCWSYSKPRKEAKDGARDTSDLSCQGQRVAHCGAVLAPVVVKTAVLKRVWLGGHHSAYINESVTVGWQEASYVPVRVLCPGATERGQTRSLSSGGLQSCGRPRRRPRQAQPRGLRSKQGLLCPCPSPQPPWHPQHLFLLCAPPPPGSCQA